MRASSSPAARRRPRPQMFAGMAEVDRVVGNDDKMRGEAWRDARAAFDGAAHSASTASEKIAVADIMAVREMAPHLLEGFQNGLPRVFVQVQNGCDHRCTFCIIPYRPRQFALGADGRGGRSGPRAGRARPCRDRADRRRSHQLRRRSAGRAETRPADQADPAACAGAEAVADFIDRFDRGRSRSARCDRRRRTPDAASASVAAIRRRSDPEADEAAAFPRATRSSFARRCGGCGRTSRSAPTSSRAFRPRPRRCSRARWIWWRNAVSPSCTCFPIRRGRARRRRGCRRSRATRSRNARGACARPARRRCSGGWRRRSARRGRC